MAKPSQKTIARFDAAQRNEIASRYNSGAKEADLCADYKCGPNTLRFLLEQIGCKFRGRGALRRSDVTGQRFGELIAIKRLGTDHNGHSKWLFQCDCGETLAYPLAPVRKGKKKNCHSEWRVVPVAGQKFGRLTVLGPGSKTSHWSLKCECGKRVEKSHRSIRQGKVKSCGCLRQDLCRDGVEDLVGQKFGRLTVVSRAGSSRHNKALWRTLCECGEESVTETGALRSGAVQSCGCLKAEISSDRFRAKGLEGGQFGELVVRKSAGSRDGNHFWLCDCSCGNTIELPTRDLTGKRVKCCGHTHRLGDLVGKKYGMLTIREQAPARESRPGERAWLCDCDCGGQTIAITHELGVQTNSCGCLTKGTDSIDAWLAGEFRSPEREAFFYIFEMANYPGLVKPGIAIDMDQRADEEYGALFDYLQLPRLEAWLVEQALLRETRLLWSCPPDLLGWTGSTEIRRQSAETLFSIAIELNDQLQEMGRDKFAIQFVPMRPEHRDALAGS